MLPQPTTQQTFWDISALEAGFVNVPLKWILDNARDDERIDLPAFSFLLQHNETHKTFLFDLGIRKDWHNLPPAYVKRIKQIGFHVEVPQDAIYALARGGLRPEEINYVCLSHIHFDHIGDTKPFTSAVFLAGEGSRPMIEDGYPTNPESLFASDLLPEGRTRFLSPSDWPPLGPFEHALDVFADGSLYIIDAGEGHLPGHVNLLARTSSDGGWVYLAGDSAHDHRLFTGEARIAKTDMFGCAHRDVVEAAKHIAKIKLLMDGEPRVKVILAHDRVWYDVNKGNDVFWPGKLRSL